ncbi:aspartyl/glutamyl-tRNA amidotransferase subunit C [Patescibacteria group bacterium]|nr:aspartyl/glutamyl-tRNA amidotransferase subunit C [Patescibacteria group bacterium]
MISREEIENLAELARLEVHDAEVEALQKDMAGILAYVEAVSAAEIPNGLAGRDMSSLPYNVMRDDTPRTQDDPLWAKEEALRQAFPTSEGGYNVVRKIIQKDE